MVEDKVNDEILRIEQGRKCRGITQLEAFPLQNPVEIELKIYKSGRTVPICPYFEKEKCVVTGLMSNRVNCCYNTP